MTIDVVSSYVGQNNIRPDNIPALIASTHEAISQLESGNVAVEAEEPAADSYTPAVSVRKSLSSRDHIISLIDGKPYKTLRRHLASNGLTPEQYRDRYKLKGEYPMVAPSYSETRKALAQRIGFGRKSATATPTPEPEKTKRVPRQKKATPAA